MSTAYRVPVREKTPSAARNQPPKRYRLERIHLEVTKCV